MLLVASDEAIDYLVNVNHSIRIESTLLRSTHAFGVSAVQIRARIGQLFEREGISQDFHAEVLNRFGVDSHL